MPASHLAGGLFILGFDGLAVDAALAETVRRWRPAGFILFRRNIAAPEQVARLCRDLRRLYPADDPPLISVDQEGGRVARLRAPFTELPAARVLGRLYARSGSLALVQQAAAVTAAELTAVGINFNFAPVLDVDSNPDNPIIGDRAYGGTPELVSAVARAVVAAYQAQGLMACGKHFPGHGDTDVDSHVGLPVVNRDRESLEDIELPPFRDAAGAGVAAMMTAHVLYPALDPDWPATLSRSILTGLLREEMGFDGLIVTDNMEMRGVWGRWPPAELARRAVGAGCDLFIGGGGGLDGRHPQTDIQFALMEALAAQIAAGEVPRVRVEASLARIRRIKASVLRAQPDIDPNQVAGRIGTPEHQAVAAALRAAATAA
ncbi:beta-N-acetylhexosaminidase [uncultured Thiohalocapsa sp.]|uniref:beta-N-acetylhexosaminidase n=1 Tax=uncultured Thiohalocapsa sp. TaxID=768990 RepID=UPI0025EBEBBE|nr:beta-N-acetylhexosaminidase [uncultured Thiohalocapsa sp.]